MESIFIPSGQEVFECILTELIVPIFYQLLIKIRILLCAQTSYATVPFLSTL